MTTKQIIHSDKLLQTLQEAETSHYRRWKSGKKWLYSATTLALLTGGTGLAFTVSVNADVLTTPQTTATTVSTPPVPTVSTGTLSTVSSTATVTSGATPAAATSTTTSSSGTTVTPSSTGTSSTTGTLTAGTSTTTSGTSGSTTSSTTTSGTSSSSSTTSSTTTSNKTTGTSTSTTTSSSTSTVASTTATHSAVTTSVQTTALNPAPSGSGRNVSLAAVASGYYNQALSAYNSEKSAADQLSGVSSQLGSSIDVYNSGAEIAQSTINNSGVTESQLNAVKSTLDGYAQSVTNYQSETVSDEAVLMAAHSAYKKTLVAYQSALDAYLSIPEASTGVSDSAGGDDAAVEKAYNTYLSDANAARAAATAVLTGNDLKVQNYVTANSSRDAIYSDISTAETAKSALDNANSTFNQMMSGAGLITSDVTSAYNGVLSAASGYDVTITTYKSDVAAYQSELQALASANGMSPSDVANITAVDPAQWATFNSEYSSYGSALTAFESEFVATSQYMVVRDHQLTNQPAFPSTNIGTDGISGIATPSDGQVNTVIKVTAIDNLDINNLVGYDVQAGTDAFANTLISKPFLATDSSRPISPGDKAAIVQNNVLIGHLTPDGSGTTSSTSNLTVTSNGSASGYGWLANETSIQPSYTAPNGQIYQLAAIFTSYNTNTTNGHPVDSINNLYFLNPKDPIGDFESLPLNWSLNNGQNLNIWFIYMPEPVVPKVPTPPAPTPLGLPQIGLVPAYTVTPPTPKPPLPAPPGLPTPPAPAKPRPPYKPVVTPPTPPAPVKPTPPAPAKPAQPTLPDTGESSNAGLFLGGLVTMGAAGVILVADRKKRKFQLFEMTQKATHKDKA